jgi:hypothetical protein
MDLSGVTLSLVSIFGVAVIVIAGYAAIWCLTHVLNIIHVGSQARKNKDLDSYWDGY